MSGPEKAEAVREEVPSLKKLAEEMNTNLANSLNKDVAQALFDCKLVSVCDVQASPKDFDKMITENRGRMHLPTDEKFLETLIGKPQHLPSVKTLASRLPQDSARLKEAIEEAGLSANTIVDDLKEGLRPKRLVELIYALYGNEADIFEAAAEDPKKIEKFSDEKLSRFIRSKELGNQKKIEAFEKIWLDSITVRRLLKWVSPRKGVNLRGTLIMLSGSEWGITRIWDTFKDVNAEEHNIDPADLEYGNFIAIYQAAYLEAKNRKENEAAD
ncbi:MAG TPA: hypothetical protein ENI70_00925 [Candidatus Peregrinibacteria bacterium]|nr:hypothetical protein [Candidatus Peregrinibacteria bacterium]